MSFVSCKNCNSVVESSAKFCNVCGNSLENVEVIQSRTDMNRIPTFFCPKCQFENTMKSILCDNCGEDFGKYNIRANLSETSTSRKAAAKDSMKSEIFRPSQSSVPAFIRIFSIISGIIFVILLIISLLATYVWMWGMGSLGPAFLTFIFGIFWLSSTIGWILSRRRIFLNKKHNQ